jgi:hypothetical protein
MAENTFLALRDLDDVEYRNDGGGGDKELYATILDMKVCAFLALYHSHKILASLNLKLFYSTRDRRPLRAALDEIHRATASWEQLISLTRGHYNAQMVSGPTDAGSWEKKLLIQYEEEWRVAEI